MIARRLILAFAVLAGFAVLALPDVGEPWSSVTAEVLRGRECRILEQAVTRRIRYAPQVVDEIETHEWCRLGATLFLVRRTFWRIDGVSPRNENNTPQSFGKVLWESLDPVAE